MVARFCDQCGGLVAPDSRFCSGCGRAIQTDRGDSLVASPWVAEPVSFGLMGVTLFGRGKRRKAGFFDLYDTASRGFHVWLQLVDATGTECSATGHLAFAACEADNRAHRLPEFMQDSGGLRHARDAARRSHKVVCVERDLDAKDFRYAEVSNRTGWSQTLLLWNYSNPEPVFEGDADIQYVTIALSAWFTGASGVTVFGRTEISAEWGV